MSSDFLFIEDFQVPCRIGITDEEKAFPQIVTVCLKLFLPLEKPAKTDNIKDTVDYAAIVSHIKETTKSETFFLVETLAERIAEIVLSDKRIDAVEVKASKKVFADIAGIGACITRRRS